MERSLDGAVGRLVRVAAVHALGRLADRELLERFVAGQEVAFTVLIERHGPMVYGVCRRALACHHDAEDACQATFLVLARQAASLRKKDSLGSFLHGVARRVATGLKRQAIRRKNREDRASQPAPADPASEVTWREVQAVLDEELARLPERYRLPLILCYLEGLTRDEAARRLGLSSGGLHGRLERGRDLLRLRLSGRGLSLSSVLCAVTLGESATHALSPALVVSSARAAALFAARQPVMESVGANVLALAQEVLETMSFAKVKVGAAVVCAALLALAGRSFVSLGNAQDAQDARPKAREAREAPTRAESDRDFIRRISKDLRDADPTPAEVHFFVANKDAGKRQKLIDLFIQERQARKAAAARDANKAEPFVGFTVPTLAGGSIWALNTNPNGAPVWSSSLLRPGVDVLGVVNVNTLPVWSNHLTNPNPAGLHPKQVEPARLGALQKEFYKGLRAAKDKSDVARVTQSYLDRLIELLKQHPDSREAPDAIRQIVLIYDSQGKNVEADAWRAKLPKEPPAGGAPPKKH